MRWVVRAGDTGRWPRRVLTSAGYSDLLALLTRDADRWQLRTRRNRRRGPRGNPDTRYIWDAAHPIAQPEVAAALAGGWETEIDVVYADGSRLRADLVRRSWTALAGAGAGTAHERAASAAAHIEDRARWWPARAVGTLLTALAVLAWLALSVAAGGRGQAGYPAALVGGYAAFFAMLLAGAAMALPHSGIGVADRPLPFALPPVVIGRISVMGAAGALASAIAAAVITKLLG